MQLCYFDENKHGPDQPIFTMGGLIVRDAEAVCLENELREITRNFFGSCSLDTHTELHGKELFHGKGNCRFRSLADRIAVFRSVSSLLIRRSLPVHMIQIDVAGHRARCVEPTSIYSLGFMLMLECFSASLEEDNDIGLIFGDHDQNEVAKAVADLATYKQIGNTPMCRTRSLARIVDTAYFPESHHSRFIQIADLLVYLAGRYEENPPDLAKWHEQQMLEVWNTIKASGNVSIHRWPRIRNDQLPEEDLALERVPGRM